MIANDPFEVQLLTPPEFDDYWLLIAKELDRVPHIWNVWWTKEYLYEGGMSGRFQVWAVGPKTQVRLVLFSQVVFYPANRILQAVCMIGNSFEECAPVLEACLVRWAQLHECTVMEVVGRPGLEKALAPYGLRKSGVVLSKAVPNERIH